jgi:two-component system sensor histidine kinase YesM
MKLIKNGRFEKAGESGVMDEIGVMISSFNQMIEDLEQLIYENYEVTLQMNDIEIKKREAELYALQSQVNPHFLFNTLESIRMGLHKKGDEESADIVLHLSKVFRKSLNWEGEIISVSEEIEFVINYLEIQRYRFKDKLRYSINLPQELGELQIPKLTIQPLVENAVIHGIEEKYGNGTVSVDVTVSGSLLEILVKDDGTGISADKMMRIQRDLQPGNKEKDIKKSGSIGLKNVHDRIVLHYGAQFGLAIESEPGHGTTIRIRLPALENRAIDLLRLDKDAI